MKKIVLSAFAIISMIGAYAQKHGLGLSYLANDYYSVQTEKMTLYYKDSSWFKTYDPGVRLSYVKQLSRFFDFQGNLNYSKVDVPGSVKDSTFILRRLNNYVGSNPKDSFLKPYLGLDARINLNILDKNKWILAPYIFTGLSCSMIDSKLGANVPVGAGVYVKLAKKLSLHAEGSKRFTVTDLPDLDRFQYAVGLTLWGGKEKIKEVVAVVLDRDNDGVNDNVDNCPDVPGVATLNGCPDSDGDGIADAQDNCPMVQGIAKYNGCPIPDTDGDGFNDEVDKCPSVAGLTKYEGCPIPDTDGDGFNDEVDRCPTVASSTNNGCPEIKKDVIEKVKKAAGAVYFDTGKSTIKKTSLKQLDVIAAVLNEDPTLFCDIAGHTDNSGNHDKNVALSQARAKACLDYLVSKGISASRLTSEGFGPDQPIQDNATAAGKAKNRRTEFKLRNF